MASCADRYRIIIVMCMALPTGLLRAATREDIIKFKCMHGEQMIRKCKEFSAEVSHYQLWRPAACLSVDSSYLCVPEREAYRVNHYRLQS